MDKVERTSHKAMGERTFRLLVSVSWTALGLPHELLLEAWDLDEQREGTIDGEADELRYREWAEALRDALTK